MKSPAPLFIIHSVFIFVAWVYLQPARLPARKEKPRAKRGSEGMVQVRPDPKPIRISSEGDEKAFSASAASNATIHRRSS